MAILFIALYLVGSAAELVITGYVEERWGFDDNVTREMCLIGSIIWPVVLLFTALFWIGRGLHNLGGKLT